MTETETLRLDIMEAVREAATALREGEPGSKAQDALERAQTLTAQLRALSLRIGSAEGYHDAIWMGALVEKFRAELAASKRRKE